jgi:hypothetical protein
MSGERKSGGCGVLMVLAVAAAIAVLAVPGPRKAIVDAVETWRQGKGGDDGSAIKRVAVNAESYAVVEELVVPLDAESYFTTEYKLRSPHLIRCRVEAESKPFNFVIVKVGDEDAYWEQAAGDPPDHPPAYKQEMLGVTTVDITDLYLETGEWNVLVISAASPPEPIVVKVVVEAKLAQ